jgi:integrase
MDQIRLGGSGLHVSRVCLGMMSYGNDSDRYTRRELADEPETRLKPKPKPRHVANHDRATTLLDALPDGERAAWATAIYAGLRVGELRALRWRHVDFDAGVIRVEAGLDDQEGEQDTKTTAGERTIPLVGRLRAELARHKLATGRGDDDLCFGRTAQDAFVRTTARSLYTAPGYAFRIPVAVLRNPPCLSGVSAVLGPHGTGRS